MEDNFIYLLYGVIGLLFGWISHKLGLVKTKYVFFVGMTIGFISFIVLLVDDSTTNDLGAAMWMVLGVFPSYVIGLIAFLTGVIKKIKKNNKAKVK